MRSFSLWIAISLIGLADAIWAHILNVRLVWIALPFILMAGAVGFFYTRFRPNERIAALYLSSGAIFGSLCLVGVLAYLHIINNPVAIDASLSRIDHFIGFDWITSMRWLDDHRTIKAILTFSYWSITPQMVIAPILLTAINRPDRLHELTWLLVLSLIVCGLASLIFTADCAWSFYGVELDQTDACRLPTLQRLRTGEIKEIVVGGTLGIITFPSFHAATGLILIWASRGVKYLFPISVLINFAMIAATPNIGGHYLVDVIAGLVIAAIFIVSEGLYRPKERI